MEDHWNTEWILDASRPIRGAITQRKPNQSPTPVSMSADQSVLKTRRANGSPGIQMVGNAISSGTARENGPQSPALGWWLQKSAPSWRRRYQCRVFS